jgi:two-component system sensor histidine kinase ChiS
MINDQVMRTDITKNISNAVIALMLWCIFVLPCAACDGMSQERHQPAAVKGTLDLRSWDFSKDGPVHLDGGWEFCPGRLLKPADFPESAPARGCGFITVPGLWKDLSINGTALPGIGHGTYHLRILRNNGTGSQTMTIRRIYTDYTLWINGKLADNKVTGKTSRKSRDDYIFVHTKRTSSFTLNRGVNHIVIQVSNHQYESGGIGRPLQLEDGAAAARKNAWILAVNMIVVGLLLFAAVYNIILYSFRRMGAAPLYFGFFCLLWSINIFNVQIPILPDGLAWPRNPYIIDYLTIIISIPLCLMAIRSLFPEETSLFALRFFLVITPMFLVPLLFIDFATSDLLFKIYSIFTVIFILYYIFIFARGMKNREEDSLFFLIGFLLLFLGGINDLLYYFLIIDTAKTAQYGILVLCIAITLLISRRFSRAIRRVEELSRELIEMNTALKEMDTLKDRFLANTSHELRTPLHGMIGLSETMIEGAADVLPSETIENLTLIASNGHRLAGMVNDLLDMAKIQDEGINLNLRPVDMHSVSETVVRLILPLAAGKPLTIINTIESDILPVRADEDRIRQVLYNLIGNAIKFTNRGTIEISARPLRNEDEDCSTEIEISVSDTGIGIPAEYREIIFEAYRQVDEGDTRAYPGTGLGLAIAKQIVELHGGTIWVTPGHNGGSTFSFTLPVSEDTIADTAEESIIGSMDVSGPCSDTVPDGWDGTFSYNPVLLVVDDDPVNIRVLRNYLEAKQCIVKTATDGIEALDIIAKDGSIDLVLLDIMMPVMSGCEVCRRIREDHSHEELPVIMLTAKNETADVDAAFESGANDYIVKPFRVRELLTRVHTMLQLRNNRKTAAEGIFINNRNRTFSIPFSTILYITSHRKSIVIHTAEEDIELPLLIKEIIDQLPPDIFVRIHKSHIINLHYLHSISHVRSGRYRVRLRDDDDTELPVGPAFLEELRGKTTTFQ